MSKEVSGQASSTVASRSLADQSKVHRVVMVLTAVVLAVTAGGLGAAFNFLGPLSAVGVGLLILVILVGKPQATVKLMLLLLTVQAVTALNLPIGSTRPSELLALLCLSGLVLQQRGHHGSRRPLLGTVLDKPLLVFLLVIFASSALSLNIDPSQLRLQFTSIGAHPLRNQPFVKSYTQIVAYLLGIAAFYATVSVLWNRDLVRIGLRWWVGGAVFSSLVGIYGFLAALFPLPFYDVVGARSTSGIPRIRGLAAEPRHLAIFLAPLVAFLVIATVYRAYIMRPRLQWAALLVVFLGFLLTLSRSTITMSAAVLALVFLVPRLVGLPSRLFHLGSGIAMALVVGGALLAASFFLVSLTPYNVFDVAQLQWASLFDPSNYSNWQQIASYETAWKVFLDNPVLGVGVGNYPFYVSSYLHAVSVAMPSGYGFGIPSIVNCIYLEVMAETGVIGLVTFGAVLFALLRYGFRAAHGCTDSDWKILIAGLCASFLAVLVSSVWSSAFFTASVWALMGLLCAASAMATELPGNAVA